MTSPNPQRNSAHAQSPPWCPHRRPPSGRAASFFGRARKETWWRSHWTDVNPKLISNLIKISTSLITTIPALESSSAPGGGGFSSRFPTDYWPYVEVSLHRARNHEPLVPRAGQLDHKHMCLYADGQSDTKRQRVGWWSENSPTFSTRFITSTFSYQSASPAARRHCGDGKTSQEMTFLCVFGLVLVLVGGFPERERVFLRTSNYSCWKSISFTWCSLFFHCSPQRFNSRCSDGGILTPENASSSGGWQVSSVYTVHAAGKAE